MPTVSVVIGPMPRMLRDVVSGVLSSGAGSFAISHVEGRDELLPAVLRAKADVLLVECDEAELPAVGDSLWDHRRRLRLVALVSKGRVGILYELTPTETVLRDFSPEVLLRAVRGSSVPLPAGEER